MNFKLERQYCFGLFITVGFTSDYLALFNHNFKKYINIFVIELVNFNPVSYAKRKIYKHIYVE